MGLSMREQKTRDNVEKREMHFDLVESLGLLPLKDETREQWFTRVRTFEQTNGIELTEVVDSLRALNRKKEAREKAQQLMGGGVVVPDSLVDHDLMDEDEEERLREKAIAAAKKKHHQQVRAAKHGGGGGKTGGAGAGKVGGADNEDGGDVSGLYAVAPEGRRTLPAPVRRKVGIHASHADDDDEVDEDGGDTGRASASVPVVRAKKIYGNTRSAASIREIEESAMVFEGPKIDFTSKPREGVPFSVAGKVLERPEDRTWLDVEIVTRPNAAHER